MKRYTFFLILFLSSHQLLKAHTPDPLYLRDAYRKGFVVPGKDTAYYQRLFFKALPSDFKTFDELYGWNYPLHVGRPLSAIPSFYFQRIFNSKAYSREASLKKIISISINGVYGVQAIGAFQRCAIQLAEAYNAEFLRELKRLNKAQIVSVWKFYFDNPNEVLRETAYQKLRLETAGRDKKMLVLLNEGYQKAIYKLRTTKPLPR